MCAAGACDDAPLAPRDTEWQKIAVVPGHIDCIAEDDAGTVWLGGYNLRNKPAIFKYANDEIKEVYWGDYNYGSFMDICYGNNTIWAAGFKYPGPILVRYDGRRWQEIKIPPAYRREPNVEDAFNSVEILSHDAIILAGDRGVYIYEKGEWRKPVSGNQLCSFYLAFSPPDIVYAFQQIRGDIDTSFIYVSADRGNTWTQEKINLNLSGFTISSPALYGFAIKGDRLCLGQELQVGPKPFVYHSYIALLERDTSPPGAGNYDVSFLAPNGPYFSYTRALTFRDRNNGYGVGDMTSVALVNGTWVQEKLPWGPRFFSAVTAGRSGYWAAASSYSGGGISTLYKAPFR